LGRTVTNNSQPNCRQYNIERNLEDVTLIWCDQNMDDSSNLQNMQILLKQSIN
ncbi:unnamed protein product, partial [Rotaria sp. Silwood1]